MSVTTKGLKYLSLVALLASKTTLAAECFAPSPNLQKEGDDYYELKKTYQWDSDESKLLEDIYRALEGDWTGHVTEFECFGSDKNPRKKLAEASVEARITESTNLLFRMSTEKEYLSSKIVRNEVYHAYNSRILYSGTVKPNYVEGSDRMHIANARGGARLQEAVQSISLSGEQVSITRLIYINGYLAREEIYELTKDD
ncbi:hypothetical protein BTA51_09870 [Hahella sp. CCB-MM4]|uniref:hypothetical protein n=1 Tax=Hahella sp. (strain CCB-MM4) TaxID=1926491 RepID=UPI000B9BD1E6|nr:hypothetical protein [Hahella sp. CCB-MM4]OZG73332.1 hypothetical protein BTA51_09870 [Hahella sp. CCB-MM4]